MAYSLRHVPRRKAAPTIGLSLLLVLASTTASAQPVTTLTRNASNPNPDRRTYDLRVEIPHESGRWLASSLRVTLRHAEFFDFFGGPAPCCPGNFFGQPWEYSTFVTTPTGLPNTPGGDAGQMLLGVGSNSFVWTSTAIDVLWTAPGGRVCDDALVARLTLQNLKPGWRVVISGAHNTGAPSPFNAYPFEFVVSECTADLDGDSRVDQSDLGILLSCYNTGDCGDLDGDGLTGQADLGTLLAEYGCGSGVPLRIDALPPSPAEAQLADSVLFRALVTPAANPPSAGMLVRLNRPGAAALNMFDDGTNGDAVPGDLVYSRLVTAQQMAPPGRQSFAIIVSDQHARRASGFTELLIRYPEACLAQADLNGNARIDRPDLALLIDRFGCEGPPPLCPDLDGDGFVLNSDLALLLSHYGCESP